jgi:hypothetical protein
MTTELLKIGKKLGVFISIKKLYPKVFLEWLNNWADLRNHKEYSRNGKYTEWALGYKQAVRDIKNKLEYYPTQKKAIEKLNKITGDIKMKEIINFEEFLDDDLKWKKAFRNSSEWYNIDIDNKYDDYTLYWCSNNDGQKIIYRNKKKKTCDKCGSELK